MRYVIYIDVFFMVNLIMDTIILLMASYFIKPQTTFFRCLLGGMTGSFLGALSLLISYENMIMHMLISYIFIAVIMVFIAFGRCNVKTMIWRTGYLYVVTILLGGIMNLIYDYTYFGYIIRGMFETVYSAPLNIIRMCLFTAISYIVLRAVLHGIQKKKSLRKYVEVKLMFKGAEETLKGLVDTGNALVEPYLGKPVHIVEYGALQRILEGVDIHKEKYRLVPFHSLGRKNGLVEVIEIDELLILEEDKILYSENKPAIGLYYSNLSGNKQYEILLNQSASVSLEM